MGKRTCGCGERGRHKPTCSLLPVSQIQLKEEETLSVSNDTDFMRQLYNKYYGKPPELEWSFLKERQATVEKRIKRLVIKMKPFYLTVTKPDDTIEEWFIDGGNWASAKQANGKYHGMVGHINNLLPFIKGRSIIWELVAGKTPKRRKRK